MPQKWPLFSSKHLAPSSGTAIIDRAPAGVATSAFVPYSIGRPQTVFSPTAYAIIASRQEFHQAGLPRNSALCSTKAPGSVACDTQTFAALVAGNAGNTICIAD